jgi:3-dehydroquinate synthase
MVGESVRIKSDVVSRDERESDLRRILNFGHTVGHALEAETKYERFLHGEAVGFGMAAATRLAHGIGLLSAAERDEILGALSLYSSIRPLDGVTAEALAGRLTSDKKTVQGKVHFVLPDRIGHVVVRSDVDRGAVLEAIRAALQ